MVSNSITLARVQRRTTAASVQLGGLRLLPVMAAVVVWVATVRDLDPSRMNDYGLISILQIPDFVAIVVLMASFCVSLRDRPLNANLLLVHVVALIFMLYGVTALVEDVPRFESAWKHVGITEYVTRNHSVDPSIDAYFNWPVFFVFLAFLTEVCGFPTAMSFVAWAPVVQATLYLGPLLMIFRRATTDGRLIWLSIWTFYLANWIGQDYVSPQGFNYLIFLAIVAVLLTWFPVAPHESHPAFRLLRRGRLPTALLERVFRWVAPPDRESAPSRARDRYVLLGIVVMAYMVSVSSHQLSPFAILGAVTALVILNRCNARGLPVAMAVMAALWLRFMAQAYLSGHSEHVTGQVGAVGESVGANMTSRLSGSVGHLHVVYIRSGMTAALWGLAALGGIVRLLRGRRDFTFALLAAAPFPLIGLQSYGGEMLLRVYLLSLPFMAFFAASIFYRSESASRSWFSTSLLVVACLVATALFFVTRYGNERMDFFTPREVEAVDHLYDIAPPGSLLLAGTVKTPWKHRDYEKYRHRTLAEDIEWRSTDPAEPDLESIVEAMRDQRFPAAYLVITRSQIANDEMFGLLPFSLRDLPATLKQSASFELIYENADAMIFVLAARDADGDQ